MPASPDDAPVSPESVTAPTGDMPERDAETETPGAEADIADTLGARSAEQADEGDVPDAERVPLSLRATRSVLRAVGSMPPPALRMLAGRKVVIDGQTLDPEAQVAIRFLESAPGDRIEDLRVVQARAELDAEGWLFGATTHIASVRDLEVSGDEGPLPARLYDPAPGADKRGLLVFFHGGGYVLGGLDTSDPLCRFLARCSGLAILSVHVRLAPEYHFPAAPRDAMAAARYVVGHLDELGCPGAKVLVGGESSGGGLAAVVAQQVDDIAGQLLVTPWLDLDGDPEKGSRWLFGDGFLLSNRQLDWYRVLYLDDDAHAADPLASPARTETVEGLPPAVVFVAGFDPLRDDARAYAARLADAGVPLEVIEEPGLPHAALNGTGVSRRAREVVDEIGSALGRLLDGTLGQDPATSPDAAPPALVDPRTKPSTKPKRSKQPKPEKASKGHKHAKDAKPGKSGKRDRKGHKH